MQRFMLVGGLLVLTIAVGCSKSDVVVTQPPIAKVPAEQWSSAVLKLRPDDGAAQGTILGIVVDSTGAADPGHFVPIAGAAITLGSMMPPAAPGYASSTAILVLGHVVAGADGRFAITSLPKGYYYLGAQTQDGTLRSGAASAELRGSADIVKVTIYVPHSSQQ